MHVITVPVQDTILNITNPSFTFSRHRYNRLLLPTNPVAEATTFATCNGQQMMLKRQKRLNFLPERRQSVLLMILSLFRLHYFTIITLLDCCRK